jgi:myo-inositol 2-dehydrogenase/D-chiro-inositol 1-dehydrogenase
MSLSRRRMLKASAAAAAAISIVPRHVLGAGRVAPSEQLTKAVIGVGGMGRGHLQGIDPDSRLLGVCDVDEAHIAEAIRQVGPQIARDVKTYRDYRELLTRDDIDIIHIATPPHWHGLISLAAANAGKDIWCEKPMTRTIAEGEAVRDAVKRNGRIFRLNTWFRFQDGFYGMGTTVKPIKKIVNSGLLGWPLKATISAHTGFAWKLAAWQGKPNLKPEPIPKNLDYNFWLGPSQWKPYHPHRVHQSFRGYWDYDGGGLGDMGQHYLDPVQYLLNKDNDSPVEIEADTPTQHPDAVIPWTQVRMKYADGCELVLDGDDSLRGAAFLEGPGGKLYQELRSTIPNLKEMVASMPDPEPQLINFTTAVKTRRKFALNESNGHRSCTIVNLAKIAVRLGRPLKFDPVTQRFPGDAEANRLAEQPMRGPWHM